MAYSNIDKSSLHFNTKLYTGTGSAPNAQTGIGFQPDFLWIKPRNMANDHRLHSPLLTGSDYFLHANATNAEQQSSNSVTSFDTDGFTLGTTDAGWNGSYNYFAHNWKANGAGSSNTDGDITATVSANTTAGFSIVKYTGNGSASNIGHGLGSPLKCIIIKKTSGSADWLIGHVGNHETLSWKYGINFNTDAVHESGSYFADTAPTNSVFRVEANSEVNSNGDTYIAFCFAEKTGFSKFGRYATNNNQTDGAFVYCGFKPALVIAKNKRSSGYNWVMWDSKSNPTNQSTFYHTHPNTGDAENGSSTQIDMLSNGFKLKNYDTETNGGSDFVIYMAFAEAPLVGSNNVPCTAR